MLHTGQYLAKLKLKKNNGVARIWCEGGIKQHENYLWKKDTK